MAQNANFLVSVHMVTYNHQKYIAEAIDGVLIQQTNFSIELIISDDCSTDNTRQIIEKYVAKFPQIIKPNYIESNVGAIKNFAETFKQCKGKFIAICEGDDFWTDKNKLQKQVDFLEANPEYIGCFHNTEERYEYPDERSSFLYVNFPTQRAVKFKDLAFANLIPTCSVVFRNLNVHDLPSWYTKLQLGDWTLHLINSISGDFWYIPHIMAVHRLHTGSIWMLQDQKRNENYVIKAYDVMINSDTFDVEKQMILSKMKQKFLKRNAFLTTFKARIYKFLR